MGKLLSILVVDDHAVFRDGVIKIVSSLTNVKQCDEAENGQAAIAKIEKMKYDIVILDISMTGINGVDTARFIKQNHKTTKIIMFSMYNLKRQVVELIELGIDAYILKSSDKHEIIKAINHITKFGGKYLSAEVYETWDNYSDLVNNMELSDIVPKFTKREKEILNLLCQGFKANTIANKLFLSDSTINTHRSHIMKKMGVNNIVGLVNKSIELGIYSPN